MGATARPLKLTLKACLLRNTKIEFVRAENGGVGNASSIAVRNRVVWCWQPLHCSLRSNEALKVGPGGGVP